MNTPHDAPPPYSGPPPPVVASSAFVIPTYAHATSSDAWDDPSCLPPYQGRTGQRYHPYMRILPVHRNYIQPQEKCFEEWYRTLQRSTSHGQATPPPPLAPVQNLPVDRQQRLSLLFLRLLAAVPEFVRVVRTGLRAAMLAAEEHL
ncbi:hypothetical protein C0991_009549 [Blastosporella zonata]|nr:hypothetical protein C0991_009549 [Blastosporella zonata]